MYSIPACYNLSLMLPPLDRIHRYQPWFIALLGILLLGWLALTPAGLLGKADAIGYAVCHRIADRSYFLGERALPLCSRCSGMYLGALTGMMFQMCLGRRAGLPAKRVQAVLGVFLMAFAVDGVNSYLTFFPQLSGLYTPQNGLRLLTGTLMGTGMSALLLPTFHQVMWVQVDERPALGGLRSLGLLTGAAGLVSLAIAGENPLLIYPLALLSIAGLVLLLTQAYALIWVLLLKKENTFQTWRQLRPVILLALITVLVQISLFDAGRYALTGTWSGFTF